MKKILFVDWSGMFGGGPTFLLNILDGLDRQNFFPVVACSKDNWRLIKELEERKIKIFAIGVKIEKSNVFFYKVFSRFCNFLRLFTELNSIIKKEEIDILHANLFYAAISAVAPAKINKKPIIWTVHLPDDIIKYKFITKILANILDKINPTCEDFTKLAKESGINTSKFQAVYSGVDLNIYKERGKREIIVRDRRINGPIVTMVARMDPDQKRHQDFIEAAAIVLKKFPKVNFIMVGEAHNPQEEKKQKDLEELIRSKNISEKVMFAGFIPDLKTFLSGVDILTVPSLKESIPAIIIEAMAMKLPIVATRTGGIPEIVTDGETGFLVPTKSPEMLAQKISYLLADINKSIRMGENGYSRIKRDFTIEKLAENYNNIYKKILKLEVDGQNIMKILDLGCGRKKTKRERAVVVGIDIESEEGIDLVHNLNNFPYPFKDSEFDEIICSDVLEHLQNIPSVMSELHRIGKEGAVIKIRSPHFSSPYTAMDPTHVRGFSIFSFDCFCKNRGIISHNLDKELFWVKKRKIIFPKVTRTVGFLIDILANKIPLRYEQYFAYIFQAENIYIELKVIK